MAVLRRNVPKTDEKEDLKNTSFITPDFKNLKKKKKIISCIILPFSLAILVIARENERDKNEKKKEKKR